MSIYDFDEDNIPEEDDSEEETGSTTTKEGSALKIEFDTTGFASSIIETVKYQITSSMESFIREEIKKQIKDQLAETIRQVTTEVIKQMILDIYENEVITIGGGWNSPEKTYSMKDYIIEQTKDAITNNRLSSGKHSSQSFSDWFVGECVTTEIKNIILKEVDSVRKDVNQKVKSLFDEGTKELLSQTVLSVLTANETYKKIEGSISSIANK